ncbi:MAG: hypothetical protein ACOYBT_10355 [Polynucleobacter sp.]
MSTAKLGKCHTALYDLINQVGRDGFELEEAAVMYFTHKSELHAAEQAMIVEHRDDMETPWCMNHNNAQGCDKKAHYAAYDATHREERKAAQKARYQADPTKAKEIAKKYREKKKAHRVTHLAEPSSCS